MNNTFKKEERITLQREIDQLKAEGKKLNCFPLRISWVISGQKPPFLNKVLILAPKKSFKRAVDRNLIKRRIREAYRLNKSILPQRGINIFILYIGQAIEDYATIEESLKKGLKIIAGSTAPDTSCTGTAQ